MGLSDFCDIQYRGLVNTELSSESGFYENWPSDSYYLLVGVDEFIVRLEGNLVRELCTECLGDFVGVAESGCGKLYVADGRQLSCVYRTTV